MPIKSSRHSLAGIFGVRSTALRTRRNAVGKFSACQDSPGFCAHVQNRNVIDGRVSVSAHGLRSHLLAGSTRAPRSGTPDQGSRAGAPPRHLRHADSSCASPRPHASVRPVRLSQHGNGDEFNFELQAGLMSAHADSGVISTKRCSTLKTPYGEEHETHV